MKQIHPSAKDEILSRIRTALRDVPTDEKPAQVIVERGYRQQSSQSQAESIKLFISRLEDYNAGVHPIQETEISTVIGDLCQKYALNQLIMPADIPEQWIPDSVQALRDEQQRLSNEQVGAHGSVILTCCALAIAQTGTIVLDGGARQGRRVLSLLPDYAFCIVRENQIVDLVTEAITQLHTTATQSQQPITFISGPSATSDIELSRVVGVHGPRHLDVLLIA